MTSNTNHKNASDLSIELLKIIFDLLPFYMRFPASLTCLNFNQAAKIFKLDVISFLAALGDTKSLFRYVDKGYSLNNQHHSGRKQPCDYAAEYGHMPTLAWMIYKKANWTCHTTFHVAKQGDMYILKILRDSESGGCKRGCCLVNDEGKLQRSCCNFQILQAALNTENNELVKWLFEEVEYYPTDEDCNRLFWNPHMSNGFQNFILDRYRAKFPLGMKAKKVQKVPYFKNAKRAVENGNLDELKISVEQYGAPLTPSLFAKAAQGNQLAMLEYLLEQRCKHNYRTFLEAAKVGNIEVMQFLKNNNFEWGFETIQAANKAGKSDAVKWLKKNGCPY